MSEPSTDYRSLEQQTAWAGAQIAPFVTRYLNVWRPYRPFWNYEDGCIYKGALDLYAATNLRCFLERGISPLQSLSYEVFAISTAKGLGWLQQQKDSATGPMGTCLS